MKRNKPFPFSSSPFRLSGQGTMIVLLLFVLFSIVFYSGYNTYESKALKNDGDQENMQKLTVIKKILSDKYLFADKVPSDQVIDGAIKGMTQSMGDIYTRYVSQKDYEEFKVSTSGKFGGIGVTINSTQNTEQGVTILQTNKGDSADIAGLKPNDIIIAVDGTEIKGMAVSDAIALIKGEIGSTVNLKVKRENVKEELNIMVTRKEIEVKTVSSQMMKNDIGYIRYSKFSETSEKQFDSAFQDLKDKGANSLILDLRDNPGGLANTSVHLLSRFVGKDKIAYYIENRAGEQVTKTQEAPYIIDMPVVVLVNENSASASEMLSGALKDHNRATIIGQNSFGKGLIQETYKIDEDSALIVTSSQYLTPNKHEIQSIGVIPDIIVDIDKEDLLKGIDTQLQKSIDYLSKNKK